MGRTGVESERLKRNQGLVLDKVCGRYSLTTSGDYLAELFELVETPRLEPRYNVAPTQDVPAVRSVVPGRRDLVFLRWGLVPRWAQDPQASSWINARAETVATKPAFRESFEERRCLIPADGFYEWRKEGPAKQPFYLRLKSRRPFAMAGVWSRWGRSSSRVVESCAVITTRPNDLVAGLHDRMPIILEPSAFANWLDPFCDSLSLLELLEPYPTEAMEAYAVSPRVNKPANEGPECIRPSSPAVPRQMELFD